MSIALRSDSPQQLLTVDQLTVRWSVCRSTVYAMFESGELPRLRIGRAVRIPITAIEHFERAWAGA
jgi:excisionase family DNA binding protein